jgi:Holliday junction DNA helicase RuvA
MIGKLTGTLLEKHPPQILLDVGGVGYELDVVVREDAQLLYGFATRHERDTFRQLVKVTGIGPKIALAVLSGLTADELAVAIEREDANRLAKVPGIGKKTAERLILELRGKLAGTSKVAPKPAGMPQYEPHPHDDVSNALMALGYNEREAAAAVKTLPEDIGVNDGIRMALKSLAKV